MPYHKCVRRRRRRRREGLRRGLVSVGAKILPRTQINSPSDTKTHLKGNDDRVFFILKYLLMKKKKTISSRRGTFLIQVKRGGA